jgi:uncharacterized protein
MRAIVFCDDRYHAAATVRAGLAPLGAEDFEFDWVENAAAWQPESLRAYPVAVLSKSNAIAQNDPRPWLTGGKENVFGAYVREGGGLVIVHSGSASYAQVPPMRALAGGAFLHHPPECEVILEPKPNHLLTHAATAPFAIWDEHYFMALDDPTADVFLHSRSVHGVQPAGWTRIDGKGRVCVLTPGHTVEAWLHPSFQILLRNALHWVAKM